MLWFPIRAYPRKSAANDAAYLFRDDHCAGAAVGEDF
ncbi:MAG: hypothetical protein QOF62_3840 [Pyrinomonadaceae bacterium]|jgi:hypothetical protein|nr:hypothetical protein [Pyrinomonadaceae bacterium]